MGREGGFGRNPEIFGFLRYETRYALRVSAKWAPSPQMGGFVFSTGCRYCHSTALRDFEQSANSSEVPHAQS